MAKVQYTQLISGIAGTLDGQVLYRSRSPRFGFSRRYVVPKATQQNTLIGSAAKNLKVLWHAASTGYKNDFKTYASKYSNLPADEGQLRPRANSAFSLFLKMVYAWGKNQTPVVDAAQIALLQPEDFSTLATDISRVTAAVDSGYLPAVEDYEKLDNIYN